MFTVPHYRYLAAAQILPHSVNLAFGPKSGFKHKCQVRTCDVGLGPGSGFKMRPVYNYGLPVTCFLKKCSFASLLRILIFCQNKMNSTALKQITEDERLNQRKATISCKPAQIVWSVRS